MIYCSTKPASKKVKISTSTKAVITKQLALWMDILGEGWIKIMAIKDDGNCDSGLQFDSISTD